MLAADGLISGKRVRKLTVDVPTGQLRKIRPERVPTLVLLKNLSTCRSSPCSDTAFLQLEGPPASCLFRTDRCRNLRSPYARDEPTCPSKSVFGTQLTAECPIAAANSVAYGHTFKELIKPLKSLPTPADTCGRILGRCKAGCIYPNHSQSTSGAALHKKAQRALGHCLPAETSFLEEKPPSQKEGNMPSNKSAQ